jgi:hypothetical protein
MPSIPEVASRGVVVDQVRCEHLVRSCDVTGVVELQFAKGDPQCGGRWPYAASRLRGLRQREGLRHLPHRTQARQGQQQREPPSVH